MVAIVFVLFGRRKMCDTSLLDIAYTLYALQSNEFVSGRVVCRHEALG